MPAQTVNYQCPACMGPLHFSGETGKLIGDLPGSKGKCAAWMAGISLPLMALLTLLMYLLAK